MKNRSPWVNLGLVGVAFALYFGYLALQALWPSWEAPTTEPAPEYLKISTDVGADEYAYDLQITYVEISEGVTTIGDRAFRDCMGLRRISLPSSLEAIGAAAFSGCNDLTVIVYAGTVAEWQAVTKGDYWCAGISATDVVCADGTVPIDKYP